MSQSEFDTYIKPYGIRNTQVHDDRGHKKKVTVWVEGTLTWLRNYEGILKFLDINETESKKSETEFTTWVWQ